MLVPGLQGTAHMNQQSTRGRWEVEEERRDYYTREELNHWDKGLDQGYGWTPGQSWEHSPVCFQCCEMVSLSQYLSVYLTFVFRVWMSATTPRYVLPLQNMYLTCTCCCHALSPCTAHHYAWTKKGSLTTTPPHPTSKFTISITDTYVLWINCMWSIVLPSPLQTTAFRNMQLLRLSVVLAVLAILQAN